MIKIDIYFLKMCYNKYNCLFKKNIMIINVIIDKLFK